MKCIVDQYDRKGRRFDSTDDALDTSYYQWVVFVFAFQANFVKLITKSTKQQKKGKIFRQRSSTSRSSCGQYSSPTWSPRSAPTTRVRSCSVRTPISSDVRRN